MKIIKVKDYNKLSRRASEIIINGVLEKPNITIGFATGKSPLGTYENLVREYVKGRVDFSKIKTFNLDEYYLLKKNDKKSYRHYMFKNLFDKINVEGDNINLLNGTLKDFKKECQDYEEKIRRNPIDLQILGIGVNGHIGFNEPGSEKNSRTRLVNLSQETIKRNKYLDKALTMGISTIIKSKKIILLASGRNKARAVFGLVKGKIDKNIPASFLRENKNLVVIVDRKAGSLL
jgi:glucosamine-6-phosphate deaminase